MLAEREPLFWWLRASGISGVGLKGFWGLRIEVEGERVQEFRIFRFSGLGVCGLRGVGFRALGVRSLEFRV